MVQIVNLRLSAVGRMAGLTLRTGTETNNSLNNAQRGSRDVWFEDTGRIATAIYDRAALPDNEPVPGPAIIEATDTTVVVPPGWRIECDGRGLMIMEFEGDA